ncbi:biotin transporter BioY [Mesorhizobium sp. M1060]|uniref:biotin transporter BioY n=1 Tax=unclassified Mesorhizobium TaxID=325217 RepID=UPI0003CEF493|nr:MULTISPECIES: biotin transporter BioY [unclassified Mesorhizobium]ESW65452.1 biotin biosynthesis protein BioY [Mesorhizobium sp. LSJC277A00]ESW92147.1 biotin biosynthesis protein BioY [Mesorhizobium sp. LSJC269B00]ESX87475.1 biotin biosynthesis protein BioY [Mesorhizobium sp. LSHC412B00]ESZ02321.1 biotin biosynthesis protein BioY [Mesorhizobium sp. L2C089B000]ESZ38353.1 biotin biosynthesis protein BioY [Mesorhizobium sp. L2C066B000]
MTDIAFSPSKPSFSPLRLQTRSYAWQAAAIVIGTLSIALASYMEVPMLPVPMNMQTFAVTLVGALYGWRLGAITIAAWLVEGAVGLPVLSGGAAGIQHFAGPTAGYLFAFPLVGALVGWLAERGWNGNRVLLAFAGMVLGNLACLVLGTAWLALMIGLEQAIAFGFLPFLVGGLLKSALGAATLKLFWSNKADPAGA